MSNYSNTEKSLKRWLKTRVKVTMATVVGFLIAGTVAMGAEVTKPIEIASPENNITIKENEKVNIVLNEDSNTEKAIYIDGKDTKVDILGDTNININKSSGAYGITAKNGAVVNALGKNISISAKSSEGNATTVGINNHIKNKIYGIAGEIINLGNKDTDTISLAAEGKDFATGIEVVNHDTNNNDETKLAGSKVIVNSKNLIMDIKTNTNEAAGIWVQNSTLEEKDSNKVATVIVNSENTVINSKSDTEGKALGLVAMSQGILEVNGNLEVNADSAILTRGGASITVNKNNDKTIKLNGDIEFNYDAQTSGTTVNAGVLLNLSNTDSEFNGRIHVTGNPANNKNTVDGMKLGLSNGGTWNITGDSFVNELTLNGGIINVLKTEETGAAVLTDNIPAGEFYQGVNDGITTLNIEEVSGTGATVTVVSDVTEDKELLVQKVNLNIEGVEENGKPTLDLGLSGTNTDDLAENGIDVQDALKQLKDNVTGAGAESIDQTLFVNGGTLTGKVTAEVGENGEIVNMQQADDTPITAAIRDLTGINYLSWKQEMGSLSQRMGELRDSSAEHGVWARVYGGKLENGSQYDNEYQTYQVGYDKKYSVDNGKVYLGYLVSYTDGETNYEYGSGENSSVGAGIYATWMNNNGHYVDVLYKVSRLNNKFDMKEVESLKGDYDTYGISLSAEYGKRFDIAEKWFAEPSIGMHLGRLGEETYTTNTGIEISQDSIYTTEGRIGTSLGYKFNDNGNVYVRTHVVKEFAGDVDTEYERNGVFAKTSEDFGDTWFEFGIGANYRFAENVNMYADIEKSGDSTVDTEWQGNLGFRYEF